MTFEELYQKVIKAKADGTPLPEGLSAQEADQLDCLLHPERHPLIWKERECEGECGCENPECVAACIFHAMEVEDGKVRLNPEKCTGCSACIEACKNQNLAFSKDTVRAIELLKQQEAPVYALMAPAFIGQFGEAATPGKLRTALKQIGFAGMIEVAAFADILTLKEALEFYRMQKQPENFQLTSCCCPVWIAMIRKQFGKIAGHLPAAVSPMIACGRIVKELHPGCRTVFVGPCMAKKAEAKEKDLQGAIDCVLTFQELADILGVFKADVPSMEEEEKEHAAKSGRQYACTGGVSGAVKECLESFTGRHLVEPVSVDGVAECKKLLEDILEGNIKGNFFEGMACPGGCVGGPKKILNTEKAAGLVGRYAEESAYRTPAENPYVIDLIKRLGFQDVEDFLENSTILTRAL